MDKSIDDQLIREAREEGESRERLRIRDMLRDEYRYWRDEPQGDPVICIGATAAIANVLCCIDGLLPPRGELNGGD